MAEVDNPLRAAFYADGAMLVRAPIVKNVRIAKDTYRVRVEVPAIAATIRSGQFVMLRLAGCDDPLVGRALALYDTYATVGGVPVGLDLVYLVVGKLTRRLAAADAGTVVDLWGPLGNGFPMVDADHLILVAGGIGHTPFLAVANHWLGRKRYGDSSVTTGRAKRVTLCYGTRSREFLSCVDDYTAAGVTVRIATDDGTAGRPGHVTEDLRELLEETSADRDRRHIFCCGPEPMMEATAKLASEYEIPCHVSLETPMACGIGICFSCVTRVRQADADWDYKRTCVDGPIFDAEKIAW
jgi:dihydroorotate dehydrogenase electron transfer subunit